MWNWQLNQWPIFKWDQAKLQRAERLYTEGSGTALGASKHLSPVNQQNLFVELLSSEAIDTSEIEGEYLNRMSVQSSVRRELGLTVPKCNTAPAEAGVAEMMVSLYQTLTDPLTEMDLFNWHSMLMRGRVDLNNIGSYRTHEESMQIASGPDYRRKVYFEAPPSSQVVKEMSLFVKWFSDTSPQGKTPLTALTRAAISHLWFESIHPFEDGNGRLGRAISEKALAQNFTSPVITILAKTLLKHRKEYYAELHEASTTLDITNWILWFAAAAIEAQRNTLSHVEFIINKTKLLDRLQNRLNPRQEKALIRMLKEGPEGFKGGLSAANYRSLTGASTATVTRDLRDLVEKSALVRKGSQKSARYFLAMNLVPVETVTVSDIL